MPAKIPNTDIVYIIHPIIRPTNFKIITAIIFLVMSILILTAGVALILASIFSPAVPFITLGIILTASGSILTAASIAAFVGTKLTDLRDRIDILASTMSK